MVTSDAGTRFDRRGISSITAALPIDRRTVGQCALRTSSGISSTWRKKRVASGLLPSTLPTWPIMIEIETPLSRPTRIGRARKSARPPRRRKLAATQKTPVSSVRATENERYMPLLPAASGATTAAIMAQVAASGPMINWREVPASA